MSEQKQDLTKEQSLAKPIIPEIWRSGNEKLHSSGIMVSISQDERALQLKRDGDVYSLPEFKGGMYAEHVGLIYIRTTSGNIFRLDDVDGRLKLMDAKKHSGREKIIWTMLDEKKFARKRLVVGETFSYEGAEYEYDFSGKENKAEGKTVTGEIDKITEIVRTDGKAWNPDVVRMPQLASFIQYEFEKDVPRSHDLFNVLSTNPEIRSK